MGIYNSSTYRVAPLMEHLQNDVKKFNVLFKEFGFQIQSKPTEICYGDNEKQLKPTKKHLLNLLEYKAKHNDGKTTNKHRARLFSGDKNELAKAKALIEKNYKTYSKRAWYIFEGLTNPDVFVLGDDYVVVGEGKWTESHITTETSHLKTSDGEYRNQILRHIQAAKNAYPNHKIYALYLVDENCGYLNDLTKESFEKQLNNETIALSDEEKKIYKDCFYGFITWQKIQSIFKELHFLSKEEIKNKQFNQ